MFGFENVNYLLLDCFFLSMLFAAIKRKIQSLRSFKIWFEMKIGCCVLLISLILILESCASKIAFSSYCGYLSTNNLQLLKILQQLCDYKVYICQIGSKRNELLRKFSKEFSFY